MRTITRNQAIEKEVIAIYNQKKDDRIWLQISSNPVRFRGVIPCFAAQTIFSEISERIELKNKYRRFLSEEDFIIKLSNELLENTNTNFQFQQELIINKLGAHCQADCAFIVDLQNPQKGHAPISSWLREETTAVNTEALINSFIFSEANSSLNWNENYLYQVDRVSLAEDKDEHLQELAKHQIESLLYHPVIMGQKVVAFVMLHRKINSRSFKENDRFLLKRVTELLISLCAQNISSARLSDSKKKLERLATNISDVIWLVDLQLTANFVSASVKSVLNLNDKEFIAGEKGLKLQAQLKSKLNEIVQHFKAGIISKTFKIAIQTTFLKGDQKLLLSHKITGSFTKKGDLDGLIICSSDESALHQSFVNLEENEDKYRSIFENSALGLIILEKDKIVNCNKKAAQILKYDPEELKGKKPEYISPEFQPNGKPSLKASKKLIAQALSGKSPTFEWVHLSSAQEEIILEINLKAFRTDNKTFVLASWLDISEERRKSDELLRLSAAVENSPVSMVITNTDAEIEYVNPAVLKITGYSKKELLGKNPRILQSGLTPENHYKELWDALRAKKDWRGIFQNKRKNGEIYWERAHLSPMRNRYGKVSHYLAVKEDITLIKDYLEALEQQNDTLKEIAWTESHVLRAPLARLLGLLQLYKEKAFDVEMSANKVLSLMEESALEMDEIITSISTKSYEQRNSFKLLEKNPLKF
jgi:PAS domain S-box-containing protein